MKNFKVKIEFEKEETVSGLIFLGYPLHPPGQKEKKKDEHLYRVKAPMLFFSGTRDALCDLESIKGVVKKIRGRKELVIVDGGDHSFRVPKSMGLSADEVYAGIAAHCAEWVRAI